MTHEPEPDRTWTKASNPIERYLLSRLSKNPSQEHLTLMVRPERLEAELEPYVRGLGIKENIPAAAGSLIAMAFRRIPTIINLARVQELSYFLM